MATALSSDQFFESLDQLLDDESRIVFMESLYAMNYPFHLESEPNFILQRFYAGTAQANLIAEAFILCFKTPVMCRQASFGARKPMTIVDCLSVELEDTVESGRFNRLVDLLRAFRAQGVMNSEWHCPNALSHWYYLDPIFQEDTTMNFSQLEDSESGDNAKESYQQPWDFQEDTTTNFSQLEDSESGDNAKESYQEPWDFQERFEDPVQEMSPEGRYEEPWNFHELAEGSELQQEQAHESGYDSDYSDLESDSRVCPTPQGHIDYLLNY